LVNDVADTIAILIGSNWASGDGVSRPLTAEYSIVVASGDHVLAPA
jgi:hypothetical protein|tara:strand:+ start:4964 stop:5101 length:138 start_codon:yes stop_codon:yes gene_type:complete